MEDKREKRLRALVIITLIVAVAGISVAFAALSQTLMINGTGGIQAADWDIHWSAASGSIENAATESVNKGSIDGVGSTTLTLSGVNLRTPGDKIEWTFTAENAGDIDAELESITNLLSTTVTFDVSESSTLTEGDVIITLTKAGGGAIATGDTLAAKTTQDYLLTIEFDPLAASVPTHNVSITINSQFPWVQK